MCIQHYAFQYSIVKAKSFTISLKNFLVKVVMICKLILSWIGWYFWVSFTLQSIVLWLFFAKFYSKWIFVCLLFEDSITFSAKKISYFFINYSSLYYHFFILLISQMKRFGNQYIFLLYVAIKLKIAVKVSTYML